MRHGLALCLSLLTLAAQAAEKRRVTALPAASPPVIDGRLDDACWQAGDWSTGFSMLNLPSAAAKAETAFKVRHGQGNLYVAARLTEPAMEKLKATVTERDGKVYNDDSLEVMIDPTGEATRHLHFAVNALGTVYDAEVRQGGHVASKAWDADLDVAAQRGEGEWTVELAIPFAQLGLEAASRGAWGLNVARERQTVSPTELTSFAPLTGGFHQPTLFAELTLADATIDDHLWQIRRPYDIKVVQTPEGLLLVGKTFLTNQTASFRFFKVFARLTVGDATDEQVLTGGLDAGQDHEYQLAVPVPALGDGRLELAITDRATGTLLASLQEPVELSYTPLTIRLSQPSYRNSIYATQQLDQVVGTVAAALPAEGLAGASLTVALMGDGELARTEVAEAGELTAFELPVTDLPVGDYRIVARLRRGAQVLHEATAPLRKLPPAPVEIRIDEQQVTRLNGEPWLPFGWFSVPPSDYAKVRDYGVNAIIDYGAQWRKPEDQQAFLDEVAAAGLKVAFYPYPSPRMMDQDDWGRPLSAEEEQQIRENVRRWRDHPALLAWYLADEPELRPTLPERTEAVRRICAEEDPYHPTIMLNDTIAGIFKYAGGGDILMPDPYPLFLKGGGASRDIRHTTEFMHAVAEASEGVKGAWVTPQAFNYGDYGRLNNRAPNLEELRNQWWQAVLQGATGCLWYTYGQAGNYPDLGLGMPYVAAETRLLEPWILAPRSQQGVRVEPADALVLTGLRMVGETPLLIAVSVATEPVTARLDLPAGAAATWAVVGEERTVANEAGTLTDTFERYQVHLYTPDAALAGRVSLPAARAAIAAADEARRKPGNLAFEGLGTAVEVSSESQYGSTPARVLDGLTDGMRWRDGTAGKYPDWLTVTFADPTTVGRVVVWSQTITAGEVQVPDGDDWRTVAPLTLTNDETLEATFPPLTAPSVRVLVTAGNEPFTIITEVEAYAN